MLEHAFSEDGYIVKQQAVTDVKYGRLPSSRNGCGWIAAYNLQKLLGMEDPPLEIAKKLSKTLLFGGVLGTQLVALLWYLHKKGIKYTLYFTKSQAITHGKKAKCGILLCRWGKSGHYIVFENCGEVTRFFNSTVGARPGVDSLPKYFDALKPWLTVAVIVKPR